MTQPERRRNSSNLVQEMRIRAEGWSALELCAVLDIVGSRILKSDPVHGVDLLLQQCMNVLRKPGRVADESIPPGFFGVLGEALRKSDPATLAASSPAAVAQDDRPEGAGSDSGSCSPEVE